MSMQFKGTAENITKCPDCGSNQVVTAKYPDGKKYRECEGCWQIIGEIIKRQTKKKQAHTPAPWTIENDIEIFAGDRIAICEGVGSDINAAFIIKAVNCHNELLKTLEFASKALWSNDAVKLEADKRIKQIIKAAVGNASSKTTP